MIKIASLTIKTEFSLRNVSKYSRKEKSSWSEITSPKALKPGGLELAGMGNRYISFGHFVTCVLPGTKVKTQSLTLIKH